jgi:hypothetical protein
MRSLLVACAVAAGSRAEAEPRTASLTVRVDARSDCPNEAEVRAAVEAHLRRGAIVDGSPRRVDVTVSRSPAGLVANIALTEAGGPGGRRHLEGGPSCADLMASAALAVAIAIDPLVALRPADPPAASPAPDAGGEARPARPPPPPPAPAVVERPGPMPRRPATPTRVAARGGGHAASGLAPAVAAGISLGAAARRDRWSLGLALHGSVAPARSIDGGEIGARLLWADVASCAHLGALAGCAVVASGALRVDGEGLGEPAGATRPLLHLGPRASWTAGLGRVFDSALHLVLYADALVAVSSTTVEVGGSRAWSTPRLGLAAGAAVQWDVP